MFMKMSAAALGAVLLVAGSVRADAAFYTDFASWSAAVPGSTPLAIPAPVSDDIPGFQYFESGSVTYGGVQFSTNPGLGNGFLFNIDPTFFGSSSALPVLSSQQQTEGVANILITFAAPVKAFALSFDTYDGVDDGYNNSFSVSFALSNGTTQTLAGPGNSYELQGFFGVVDSSPFNSILITTLDPQLNINQLSFGPAIAPVPEPGTWVMLLLGFAGVGFMGRRSASLRALLR